MILLVALFSLSYNYCNDLSLFSQLMKFFLIFPLSILQSWLIPYICLSIAFTNRLKKQLIFLLFLPFIKFFRCHIFKNKFIDKWNKNNLELFLVVLLNCLQKKVKFTKKKDRNLTREHSEVWITDFNKIGIVEKLLS